MNKNDELLRHIAGIYAERYGEELKDEYEKLMQDGTSYPSSHMQRRVRSATTQKKYIRYLSAVAGLAACIAIILLVQYIPQVNQKETDAMPQNSPAHDTSIQNTQHHDAPIQDMHSDAASAPGAPSNDSSVQETSTLPADQDYEIIPLSFIPSNRFTQTDFTQDREKSVYSFEDSFGDDVVMTLERAANVPNADRMTRLDIGGAVMYAEAEEGYCLLSFVQDGILHELTCRYDVNTLARFADAII